MNFHVFFWLKLREQIQNKKQQTVFKILVMKEQISQVNRPRIEASYIPVVIPVILVLLLNRILSSMIDVNDKRSKEFDILFQ